MIATLKAKRQEVVKQIGELQRQRDSLSVQIAVQSAKERHLIPDADLVRPLIQKFRRSSPTGTWSEIAHELNQLGCSAPRGRRWSAVAVERWFTCEVGQ